MGGARVALAGGLILLALAVALVMSSSPETLARTNAIHPLNVPLASVPGSGSACQHNELLPAKTTAIGVSLNASDGPRVTVTVLSANTIVTHGNSAAGWLGRLVTIPVAPLGHAVREATVCVAFSGADERVRFLGVHTPARSAAISHGRLLPGRLTIEYMRRGHSSWWSLALAVARRMGLGRAWAGTWVVLLVAIMMAGAIALASWLTARDPT
jgi:hypothetical protein